jgi:hypothetical protein
MSRRQSIAVSATCLFASWSITDARGLDFNTIDTEHGATSNIPTYSSIRSRNEWVSWWRRPSVLPGASATTTLPLPPIDFRRHTLLVADSGPKPTAGYSVAVQSINDDGASVQVSIVETTPGENCQLLPVVTHPMVMVLMPRVGKPIRFQISKTINDCK